MMKILTNHLYTKLIISFKVLVISVSILFTFSEITLSAGLALKNSDIPAKSFILMEASTGLVIASENSGKQIEPASLTKLMTAYVVYENIRDGKLGMTDKLVISQKARNMEGSRMFLELNTRVSVDNLLHGLVIQSGNDSAVALAEGVAGTEANFVKMMNSTATRLGMKNTHFMNSTGMPEAGHYSSAYDIALLSRHIINDYPDHYSIYKLQSFMWNKITQPNRNTLLLKDSTVDGLKTGHTESAGFCLAASALRNNMRLITVVLNANSANLRVQAAEQLLDFGFQNFQIRELYKEGQEIANIDLKLGKKNQVKLGASTGLKIPAPKDSSQIAVNLVLDKSPIAPINKGDKLGSIQVSFMGGNKFSIDAVALESVDEVGFLKRIWLAFINWLKSLF